MRSDDYYSLFSKPWELRAGLAFPRLGGGLAIEEGLSGGAEAWGIISFGKICESSAGAVGTVKKNEYNNRVGASSKQSFQFLSVCVAY
jgi:hypothetical protein